MNKEQLATKISAKTGKSIKEVYAFIDSYISTVIEELGSNDNDSSTVVLAGLGNFSVQTRKATKGRNPRTGKEIDIAEKKVVKFSPAKKLKDAVNGQ